MSDPEKCPCPVVARTTPPRWSTAQRPRWSVDLADADALWQDVRVLAHRDALIVSEGERLFALESTTGRPRWSIRCPGGVSLAATAGDLVIKGTAGPEVLALDAATGTLRWRLRVNGSVHARPIALDEGLLVVATVAGQVVVADLRDGTVVFARATDGPVYTSPVVVGAHLVVGTSLGHVHCFDREPDHADATVELDALRDERGRVLSAVVGLAAVDSEVYARTHAHLYRLAVPDLQVRKVRPVDAIASGSNDIVAIGRKLIAAGVVLDPGRGPTEVLRAYEARTLRLRFNVQGEGMMAHPVPLPARRWAGALTLFTGETRLFAIDSASGALVDKVTLEPRSRSRPVLATDGATVYVARASSLDACRIGAS